MMFEVNSRFVFEDSGGELQWYFSQVKGTMDDEVNEGTLLTLRLGHGNSGDTVSDCVFFLLLLF